MRLPAASWSRMVTVAVVISPSTASTGSSGPRTSEKDSCHSLSSLDRISTLNRMWSSPAEQRGVSETGRRGLPAPAPPLAHPPGVNFSTRLLGL